MPIVTFSGVYVSRENDILNEDSYFWELGKHAIYILIERRHQWSNLLEDERIEIISYY